MTRFSAWNVFWQGMSGQRGGSCQWRDPEPKPHYDAVIVGGGLHGLATAYYLAKTHGLRNVAVLEKGWIGGGNAGRNTTIVRSNYARPGNRQFYEHSLKLWEELSHELNYNVMFSQRSHIALLHSPGAIDAAARNYNTLHRTGTPDAEIWGLEQLKQVVPHLNYAAGARFPVMGAAVQKRAGTARHDAVVFGMGGAHFYISQSDKGGMVFGGDLDWYKSYAQRGNLPIVQDVAEAAMSVMPCLGRVKLLRHWAGVVDMSMDGSHFICRTPLDNLYLNTGWNYGGFKATPAAGWWFADLIANGRPAPIIADFDLKRFERGLQIDERGAGPDPKLHG
ncbi:FAD-dependent oxidoreductase [Leisingera sp. MMG026]|uniref:FAD-dependent oxidoreductase n=1 Tax=Leisingera sp. MMG026 TaxID=2909982 RepID=UPI001F467287|nr:FAD-dependent oxidoreductase [Leisingera sp. MMG026]MCF6433358.1 FAD-binding oxidoreductase [Leisingera sp. MMG026]